MAAFTPIDPNGSMWCLDSAAASHMTPDEDIFSAKSPYYGSDKVQGGDGVLLPIKSIGTVPSNSKSAAFS